jgi:hypothetical protein
MRNEPAEVNGPFSYENWMAAISGSPLRHTMEYPLFTDAHIVGGLIDTYGPYQLINAIRIGEIHPARPAIILRVDNHLDNQLPQMNKTDTSRYHGGLLSDEIAALVSLCLGIRLKAGGESRMFGEESDPKGLPVSWGHAADPILPVMKRPLVLPRAVNQHHLEGAAVLSAFHRIPPTTALVLVRAARLYQEALWIIESTPELSWIMLTSAIETVAGHWRQESEPPIERLRASQSLAPLEELLASHGDENFVLQVVSFITPYMGATRTFIDFIQTFLPPPPESRPPVAFQLSWEPKPMKQSLSQIYGYRSKALHGGIPFPAPMSDAPYQFESDSPPAEIPIGLAASTKGGVWTAKDLPMLIHTFEYIVRGALLNWWRSVPS